MKRLLFLTAPSMPTVTVGTGIISWPIDARMIDSPRFSL